MPLRRYWDKTDATIIHVDVLGRYTWDEFDTEITALTHLLDHASYPVVIIWDISHAAPMPPQDAFEHLEKAIEGFPENVELSVVVGTMGVFERVMWNKVTALYKHVGSAILFVESIEDAYVKIANQRISTAQT